MLWWEKTADGLNQKDVLIPGWTKFFGLSTFLLKFTCRRLLRRLGDDTLVVFTLPFYAGVAERLKGAHCVYYAFDPFQFYDWDPKRTLELEKQMAASCDATFAISGKLADDFKSRGASTVIYSPNAASTEFIASLAQASGEMPQDLQRIARPIVGCIGQMNRSYDWNLIQSLLEMMRDVSFVFVGPCFEETGETRAQMDRVLRGNPNMHWLGAKPHEQLPNYLRHFDICLNPLAITPQNDRRSPLRLYDYLATDKPIISTAIAEALAMRNLVMTFASATEGAELIRKATAPGYTFDLDARRAFLRENTWEARAKQFLESVRTVVQRGK